MQFDVRAVFLFLLAALPSAAGGPAGDVHSFATPADVRVRHVDLDLEVDFEARVIRGTATLRVERIAKDTSKPLVLDTRGLTVEAVDASSDGKAFEKTAFELGKADPILGQALTVQVPPAVAAVRVRYATGPKAAALQWLSPNQTAGKKHPLLFTQSQAIDARSWVPLQDSPAVRFTYSAASPHAQGLARGHERRATTRPRSARATTGSRCRSRYRRTCWRWQWATSSSARSAPGPACTRSPPVVNRAATEFSDMEEFLKACEKLYGPYRWGRYDVLVMPPSFPYGGMENPRLTFASPTVLAGDKSLVALLAHELAHSWSGNLVSNATWSDFWLNEGFTVYLERRIMEAVYGKARADAEATLGRRSLEREMAELPKGDQVLHIDLTARAPVDGLTDVPYEKGALFLRHLESVYGRERFDAFLKGYFEHFAFRSITTAEFVAYLEQHLLKGDPERAARTKVAEWLREPGLPADAPNPSAASLTKVEEAAQAFATGKMKAAELPGKVWIAQEWMHFLTALPRDVGREKLAALDAEFHLTKSTNSEVIFQWLLLAVRNGYEPAAGRLEAFLTEQGRRKFLKPLYEELVKTPAGKERAVAIYRKARPQYHPVSVETVDAIVGWKEGK